MKRQLTKKKLHRNWSDLRSIRFDYSVMKPLFLLLCFMTLALSAKERDTLIISFGEDWKPYFYQTGPNQFKGIEIDLITAIFHEAKIPIRMISVPTPRGHEYLKSGDIDFLCAASYTDKRNEYARFSVPYRNETVALMVRKNDLNRYRLTKLTEIANYPGSRIAYEHGGWYGDQFTEAQTNKILRPHFLETNGLEARLKLLLANRVDLVIDDYYSLAVSARSLGISSKVAFHPLKLSVEPIHLMFSRSSVSESTVNRVNGAIKKLQKNGTIKRILTQ